MVFTYEEYKLYEIEPNFKYIGKRKMYFFSKKIPAKGTPCDLPDGYIVGKNHKTGQDSNPVRNNVVNVAKARNDNNLGKLQ